MIQFSIYQHPSESQEFWNEYIAFRNVLHSTKGMIQKSDVDKAKELFIKYKTSRMLLILSKFYFWGYIDEQSFLNVTNTHLKEIYSTLNYLDTEELLSCLGYNLSKTYLNINDKEYSFKTTLNTKIKNPELSNDEYIVYTPRVSGWFSIIENIISAEFAGYRSGKKVIINDLANWWPYDLSFKEVYSNNFLLLSDFNLNNLPMITFDNVRTYLYDYTFKTLDEYKRFSAYKRNKYLSILKSTKQFLAKNIVDLPTSSYGVIFVRGGDKFVQESIQVPYDIIKQDLKLINNKCPIYIVGDDFNIAETLINSLNDPRLVNCIQSTKQGYFLFTRVSRELCIDILKNYVICSNSILNIGCPSSNLLNASNWSNTFNFDLVSKIKSSPKLKYSLI
jgi:hypothetical protein